MLKTLRKQQKLLLTIFVSLISVVFVFWGFYGGSSRLSRFGVKRTDMASVNGDGITIQEFQQEYQNTMNFYQNMLKDKFTPEMAERFNLKQMVINQLIDQKLVIQGAQSLGVKVTDQEVSDSIIQTPFFQKEGKFDKDYYLKLLQANHLTPARYEEKVRLDLLQRKILGMLRAHIKVSNDEVLKDYIMKNDKVNLEFIRIDPVTLTQKPVISDSDVSSFLTQKENMDQIQTYYTNNQHLFKTKEKDKEKVKLFDDVKNDIARTLLQERRNKEASKKLADELWEKKNNGSDFNKILAREKLKWDETGTFISTNKYIPKIGEAEEITEALPSLKKNDYPHRYYTVHNANFIVKLKSRETADMKSFEKDKDKLFMDSLSQRQSDAYYEWLKEVRSTAKIAIRKGEDTEEN